MDVSIHGVPPIAWYTWKILPKTDDFGAPPPPQVHSWWNCTWRTRPRLDLWDQFSSGCFQGRRWMKIMEYWIVFIFLFSIYDIICYFISGWWFGTFFIFPYIGNNHPNWLIFFRGFKPPTRYVFNSIYIPVFFSRRNCPWFILIPDVRSVESTDFIADVIVPQWRTPVGHEAQFVEDWIAEALTHVNFYLQIFQFSFVFRGQ